MLHSRMERVQHQLQSQIGRILDQDLNDPAIPPLVTVHSVKASKDLSVAVVRVTFLADEEEETIRRAIEELNHAAGHVQQLLTQRITLRRHPRLKFVYTPSTHYAAEMEGLFHRIEQEPPTTQENEEAPDDAS